MTAGMHALLRVVGEMRQPPVRVLSAADLSNGWVDLDAFGLWSMRVGGVLLCWFGGAIDPGSSTAGRFCTVPVRYRPAAAGTFGAHLDPIGTNLATVTIGDDGGATQVGEYSTAPDGLYLGGIWWIAGA